MKGIISLLLLLLIPFTQASWSDTVYDTLLYVANWSKLSYCTVLYPVFQPGPLEDACPDIEFCREHDESKLVQVFEPSLLELELSGTAYVAVDFNDKKVYAVFRGSISAGDWLTDVIFNYCPYTPILTNDKINADTFANVTKDTSNEDIRKIIEENTDEYVCEDCYVHCGVYVAYSQFIQEVHEAAKPYLDKGFQLVVTGHSLGGGYAYLASLDFLLAGYQPLSVLLASLRIGNPNWNHFVDESFNTLENHKIVKDGGDLPIPSISRVYQKTDLVPRLPPGPGYTHSGLEFEIEKVRLPQLKDDIEYKGPADNYENSPYEYNIDDPLSLTFFYQHVHTLTRNFPPCNDWQFPVTVKRDDGAEMFYN